MSFLSSLRAWLSFFRRPSPWEAEVAESAQRRAPLPVVKTVSSPRVRATKVGSRVPRPPAVPPPTKAPFRAVKRVARKARR